MSHSHSSQLPLGKIGGSHTGTSTVINSAVFSVVLFGDMQETMSSETTPAGLVGPSGKIHA